MGTIFDSKTNIFKKNKPLMTDGCCEEPLPCCGNTGIGLRGYELLFDAPAGLNLIDTDELYEEEVFIGEKYAIQLQTIGLGPVTVLSVTITPLSTELTASLGIPFVVSDPGTATIASGQFLNPGTYPFTIFVVTDSGNVSFNVSITAT
jgi:hypothetical protein